MQLVQADEGFFKRKLIEIMVKRQGLDRKVSKRFVGRLTKALQRGDKIDFQPNEETQSFMLVFDNVEPDEDLPGKKLAIRLNFSDMEELCLRVTQ